MSNKSVSAQNIEEALTYYSRLDNNWDEEGGLSPNQEALINARKFWNLIQNQCIRLPSVFLSSNGEINFTWDTTDSPVYVDIGFINSGYSYYSIDSFERETLKDDTNYNEDELICLLNNLQIETIHAR